MKNAEKSSPEDDDIRFINVKIHKDVLKQIKFKAVEDDVYMKDAIEDICYYYFHRTEEGRAYVVQMKE